MAKRNRPPKPWVFEQDAGGEKHYAVWRRSDGLLLGFVEYDSGPYGPSLAWVASSADGSQEAWQETRHRAAKLLYLDQRDRDNK